MINPRATQMRVTGHEQIRRTLSGLPGRVSKRLQLAALRTSAKPVSAKAKELAPVRKKGRNRGRIQKSIRIFGKYDKGMPVAIVSPQKGTKRNDAWFAPFQEHGTGGFGKGKRVRGGSYLKDRAVHYTSRPKYSVIRYTKGGSGLPARRFMERSWDQTKHQALTDAQLNLSRTVTAYMNKNVLKNAV